MALSIIALAILVAAAVGLPNPQTTSDPIRVLPHSWRFNITSLTGPGCPDFGGTGSVFSTRPTFGSNTVDGSEIYYWHFAYPSLRAAVGPGTVESSTWCETSLSYEELDRMRMLVPKPEYRLRMHKNGTAMIATYELEDGVMARWKFTYYPVHRDPVSPGSYLSNSLTL
jgi:hypothetical protein